MKETGITKPRIIDIEPSQKLESYVPGEPQTEEPFLVQVAIFSDPRSVTLSFTTRPEAPTEQAAAEETSSFTLSQPDARKLADALEEAIEADSKAS